MSNASYSYAQVKQGNGSYRLESPAVYSGGVKTLQQRLIAIGYDITADGKFGTSTQTAVKQFQKECNQSDDGVAGKNTLTQLDKVYQSPYFTSYGRPIATSSWNREKIKAGLFSDVDLLARIIWGEDREILAAQNAVARVLRNRSNTSGYYMTAAEAPYASIWARVVAKPSQYATAVEPKCCTPFRGDSSRSDGISAYWKNAVDLGNILVSGSILNVPKGYTVDSAGNVSESKTTAVTTQLNQTAESLFLSNLRDGKVKGTAVTYAKPLDGNVFYTI